MVQGGEKNSRGTAASLLSRPMEVTDYIFWVYSTNLRDNSSLLGKT